MKKNKIITTIALFLITVSVAAQNTGPGFDPGQQDVAPLPGIAALVGLAIYIGVRKTKKN